MGHVAGILLSKVKRRLVLAAVASSEKRSRLAAAASSVNENSYLAQLLPRVICVQIHEADFHQFSG